MNRTLCMAIIEFVRLSHIDEHRTLRLLLARFRRRYFSHPGLGISSKLIESRTHKNAFEIYYVAVSKTNCLTQRRRRRREILSLRSLRLCVRPSFLSRY